MTNDQTANFVYALVLLVFIASGLFARRLPIGQMARYAFAWLGIFATGFVLFTFRGEAGRVWHRATAAFDPNSAQVENGTVRIARGEDGHFHVNADVNGHSVRFLIDSGATTTAMTAQSAGASGVDVDDGGFPVVIDTANGSAEARRARIERLAIGPIKREEFPVLVGESLGETNLLGMNFLDTLKSWRVEGDAMVLNP